MAGQADTRPLTPEELAAIGADTLRDYAQRFEEIARPLTVPDELPTFEPEDDKSDWYARMQVSF